MSEAQADQELRSSFDEVEQVVADSLRFKRKLSIGGDAYKSIRLGKSLQQLWDVSGVDENGIPIVLTDIGVLREVSTWFVRRELAFFGSKLTGLKSVWESFPYTSQQI